MDEREELAALRRMAALEAKAKGAPAETYDPTEGMSGLDKVRAGFGKAIYDVGRGVGQLVGLVDQSSIDEAKRLDAPLMKHGAAVGGNIAGNVAMAIPTVAIPGAASLPGAAAVGGVMGLMQPVASDESRLANTAMGAGAGAGGVAVGRAAMAGYQGAKALVEPFTKGGRDRIAGRMIQRFADDPKSISAATSQPTITGARPTLAEQTGDAGLARLQDSLRAADPQFNNAISGRLSDNNAARVNALRGLTGEDGARAAAVADRDAAARELYGHAFANDKAITPSQAKAQISLLKSDRIAKIMESPAIQEAMKAARTNAANAGRQMDDPAGSIEGMHQMKLALDDMIKDPTTAAQAARVTGLKAARDKLVGVIETLSPEYKGARKTYAAMSKPVNSMDSAAEVAKRGLSNASDLSGNPTINRNALLGALRDEPALLRRATGRNVGNSLADVMEPSDLNMLRAIASESDRAGAVATAGNGPGSATAQRMASQNVLRQIMGPTGLPESWAENALANTIVGKPLNMIYGGVAEPKIQQALAKAILDPDEARAVIRAAQQQGLKLPPSTMRRLLEQAGRSAAPSAAVAGQR